MFSVPGYVISKIVYILICQDVAENNPNSQSDIQSKDNYKQCNSLIIDGQKSNKPRGYIQRYFDQQASLVNPTQRQERHREE